jgi:hypothetical protein
MARDASIGFSLTSQVKHNVWANLPNWQFCQSGPGGVAIRRRG